MTAEQTADALLAPSGGSRWAAAAGALITVVMLVGVVHAILARGIDTLGQSLPHQPAFYLVFLALYAAPPAFDYVIFRRLWHIPAEGLVALNRKRIANDVLFGYSGEAYFYAWARQRARMVAAPFGAVKDVSILSAIAGNAMTLAMTLAALPMAQAMLPHATFVRLAQSTGIVIAISLPFLIFANRVFSLPRQQLWWIFGVHVVRLTAGAVLLALCWHIAMPQVSIGVWLLLSAGRLLASRLPVPNKDLLFANFAIFFIGQGHDLTNLVAVTAALTLVVHVILIVGFGVYELVRNGR